MAQSCSNERGSSVFRAGSRRKFGFRRLAVSAVSAVSALSLVGNVGVSVGGVEGFLAKRYKTGANTNISASANKSGTNTNIGVFGNAGRITSRLGRGLVGAGKQTSAGDAHVSLVLHKKTAGRGYSFESVNDKSKPKVGFTSYEGRN
jgi:hypothetical protein